MRFAIMSLDFDMKRSFPPVSPMISSLVAKLDADVRDPLETAAEIASHKGVEIADLIDGRKLPLTIDVDSRGEMDVTTRWIQGVAGVAFVDVVFVHFDFEIEKPV